MLKLSRAIPLMSAMSCFASVQASSSAVDEDHYPSLKVQSLKRLAALKCREAIKAELKSYDKKIKEGEQVSLNTEEEIQHVAPVIWGVREYLPMELKREVLGNFYILPLILKNDTFEFNPSSPLHLMLMGNVQDIYASASEFRKIIHQWPSFFADLQALPQGIKSLYLAGSLGATHSANHLRGLGQLSSLQRLDLSNNTFFSTDFDELKQLTQLEELIWSYNPAANHLCHFAPSLVNLKFFESRWLQSAVDLEDLFYCENLQKLIITETRFLIAQLNLLERFTNLTDLNFYGCKNEEMDPGSALYPASLERLCLGSSPLGTRPDRLTHLTHLQSLDLSHTPVGQSITQLSLLTNLRELRLVKVQAGAHLAFVSGLVNLEILELSTNELESVEFLKPLTKLRVLDLSHNNMEKQPQFLDSLSDMERLDLSHNKLTNIGNLSHMQFLGNLRLLSNNLRFLSPLNLTTKLHTLEIANNPWQDAPSALVKLVHLTHLGCWSIGLGHGIGALGGLTKLRTLYFDHNNLSENGKAVPNFTVLTTLPFLKTITCDGNGLSEHSDPTLETLKSKGVNFG